MSRDVRAGLIVFIMILGFFLATIQITSREAAAAHWSLEVVDSVGAVGEYVSLRLDSDGFPHISYYDRTNSDLKYASWTGNAWINETVDSSGNTGFSTSLAIDGNDHPHISYYDATVMGLKYATWTGSQWIFETVDPSGDYGGTSSIALDASGYPRISYWDGANFDLKYARWDGTDWINETVDGAGQIGSHSSIAVDSWNKVHIAYYDYANCDLKYANNTGGTWAITTIDSMRCVGLHPSIAIDSMGYPHISYYDVQGQDLRYTRWNGSGWAIETVDAFLDSGEFSSLALDSDDYPHISYLGLGLKYAKWNGTAWTKSYVGTMDQVRYTSLALGSNGAIHIGCYHYDNADLIHVGWANAPPEEPSVPSGPTQGAVANPFSYSTGTIDPDGDDVKYTFDWGDGETSETSFVSSGTSASLSHSWSMPGTYQVKANATDILGSSSDWSGSLAVTIADLPDSPGNLVAASGVGEIVLSWSAPSSDGGSPITNYRIYRGTSPGGEAFLLEIGNVMTHIDTGLTNGQTYYYQITAKNAVGEGPESNEANATPAATPELPTALTAVAGNGQVTLTWTAPASDGGSPVTNYNIYRGSTSGGEALLVTLGNVLTYTDTGLANGQTYYYKVSASNSVGEGQKSNETSATPKGSAGLPSGGKSIFEEIWFWVVITVVIIIVGISVLILRKRMGKREAEEPAEKEDEDTGKQETRE